MGDTHPRRKNAAKPEVTLNRILKRRYDRAAAVRYAMIYALAYNPTYPDLSHAAGHGDGGDCNNFVSQALFAGGWTMVYGLAHWPSNWWYRHKPTGSFWEHRFEGYASASWPSPAWFYRFLSLSDRAVQCNERDLLPGDIIQAIEMPERPVFHTMLVTSKRGNDVGLTYHTTNVLDFSFNLYTRPKFGKDVDYIYWKLSDTFDVPDELDDGRD